jgi:hypothetical protein
MNLRKKSTREEFERAFAQCKPEDFDGHTEFYRLDTRATARMAMPGCDVRLRVQRQSKSWRSLTVIALTFHLRPAAAGLRRDKQSFQPE